MRAQWATGNHEPELLTRCVKLVVRFQDFSPVDCFFYKSKANYILIWDWKVFRVDKGGEASGNEHLEDHPCRASVCRLPSCAASSAVQAAPPT